MNAILPSLERASPVAPCRLRHCARRIVAAAGATLALQAANLSAASPAPASPTAGPTARRIELFNGHDLSGWRLHLKEPAGEPGPVWSVHAGVLHLAGKPNGYLRTTRAFSNYRLHVEWRWPDNGSPKSNSGVFVHLHGEDKIWPAGVECQLASGNAGQLIGNEVALPGAPISNQKPRAPRLAASSEKPRGEWNRYDIVCRGASIDVTVNGIHQNHVDQCSVDAGEIGLQLEGHPIEFRHLWLEPL